MGARFGSWWQKIRKPLDAVIITLLVVIVALVVVVILGYHFNWDWAGLGSYSPPLKENTFQRGKTLWDWLQLLIIPAVLAVGGYLFNYTTSKNEQQSTQLRDQTERDIAADNQREAALQAYIDKMSELLLAQNLRNASADEEGQNIARVRTLLDLRGVPIRSGPMEVQKIARVRTLTVLRGLDAERKGSVLRFLYESSLIDKDNRIIDLSYADLSKANLSLANLNDANLSNANLYLADLREADLGGADLGGADLSYASLIEAIVTPEQLNQAFSLKDTFLPDGSKHSD